MGFEVSSLFMCARMLLSVLPFLRFGQKGRRLVKDRGTGHCTDCFEIFEMYVSET